jgi:hypothetical protein
MLASAPAVQAQGKRFESKEGKYTVTFPSAPSTETFKSGTISYTKVSASVNGATVSITYSKLTEKQAALKPDDLLKSVESSLIKSLGGTPNTSEESELGKEKFKARRGSGDALVEGRKVQVKVLVVLVEDRLYELAGTGPMDTNTSLVIDTFFDSVEIKK